MKDWFKARNIWGAAISALSDEEAGRLAKAIWAYTMDGEVKTIEGAGKGILAMILLTLGQDEERDSDISEKRSLAGKKGATNTNYGKSQQMISNDNKCQQMISNADNKNKNKNKNIDKEQESESESYISDADAADIQRDHDRVLTAAEDAGFKMSNDVRASLIALYAEFGLSKMLDGYKSCVDHAAANLAYLKAVLSGKPKEKKPRVAAQDYGQRDYDDVQKRIEEEQRKRFEARLKGVG